MYSAMYRIYYVKYRTTRMLKRKRTLSERRDNVMLIASLIVTAYLLIGLYFRPYALDCPLWERVVLHALWLPIVIGLYVFLRFG